MYVYYSTYGKHKTLVKLDLNIYIYFIYLKSRLLIELEGERSLYHSSLLAVSLTLSTCSASTEAFPRSSPTFMLHCLSKHIGHGFVVCSKGLGCGGTTALYTHVECTALTRFSVRRRGDWDNTKWLLRKFLSLSVMAWMPRVWFRRLNTGACTTDTHTGVSCPVFLYHRWREIDTCRLFCLILHQRRWGAAQKWLFLSMTQDHLESYVRYRHFSCRSLNEKTPVHFDSVPVGCFSSPVLLPIEKASRYRTKIKSLRQDQGGRRVYRVSLSGRNATLTSKWVSTSWSA